MSILANVVSHVASSWLRHHSWLAAILLLAPCCAHVEDGNLENVGWGYAAAHNACHTFGGGSHGGSNGGYACEGA